MIRKGISYLADLFCGHTCPETLISKVLPFSVVVETLITDVRICCILYFNVDILRVLFNIDFCYLHDIPKFMFI